MQVISSHKIEITHLREEIYRAQRFTNGQIVTSFTGTRSECQRLAWEWADQEARWKEQEALDYCLKLQAAYSL